jgi:hypothetical protein
MNQIPLKIHVRIVCSNNRIQFTKLYLRNFSNISLEEDFVMTKSLQKLSIDAVKSLIGFLEDKNLKQKINERQ